MAWRRATPFSFEDRNDVRASAVLCVIEESDVISVLKNPIEDSFLFFKHFLIHHLGDWN